MKPPVLAIVGKIASGKTTISRFIANTLDWSWASFGTYVRAEAQRRGLDDSRATLQRLGDMLLAEDTEIFCRAVLMGTDWIPGQPLLIDGIRHTEVIQTLRSLIAPQRLVIVYIKVPEDVRVRRLLRRGVNLVEQRCQEAHLSEVQVHTILPTLADIIIDGTRPLEILTKQLLNELWWYDLVTQIPESVQRVDKAEGTILKT